MRDWLKSLDELDRDCVHTYERFLCRKLTGYKEYVSLDKRTDECPMEFDNAKEFFSRYPELKRYKKEVCKE